MDKRVITDERIKTLLTSTDLTFKQIIEQLKNENISASFNTIRRVNRNHRYRKPRYEAKLTPHQRKELVVLLKNTAKPNLSLLARQFGVCHGSIWYWWDKLSKIREQNDGIIPDDEPILDFCAQEELVVPDAPINKANKSNNSNNNKNGSALDNTSGCHTDRNSRKNHGLEAPNGYNGFANGDYGEQDHDEIDDNRDNGDDEKVEVDDIDGERREQQQEQPHDQVMDDDATNQSNNDPLDLSEDKQARGDQYELHKLQRDFTNISSQDQGIESSSSQMSEDNMMILQGLDCELEIVGPVQAKDARGQYVKLPIMMYAPVTGLNQAWNLTVNGSANSNNNLLSISSSSAYSTASSTQSPQSNPNQSNTSTLSPITSTPSSVSILNTRSSIANCNLSSLARQLRVD